MLDKILTDPRWDLKFIGMQIIIEGLALAAFERQRASAMDPSLKRYLLLSNKRRSTTCNVLALITLEEFIQDPLRRGRERRESRICL